MAIILQCEKCRQISKKTYCGECKKSIDYFEVFEIQQRGQQIMKLGNQLKE